MGSEAEITKERNATMIDIGVCVSSAIEKVKQNPNFYLVGSAILCGVMFVLNFASYFVGAMWGVVAGTVAGSLHLPLLLKGALLHVGGIFIGTVISILLIPFLVGFFRGVKKEYEGEKAEFEELFSAFDVLVPSLINYAAAQLLIFVGLMLCFIPAILVAPIALLTAIYLASGVTEGMEPFMKAVDLLKKNPVIILWYIVLGLLIAVGLIVCCVGVVVTLPVGLHAYYVMFRQATGTTDVAPKSDDVVPPTAAV